MLFFGSWSSLDLTLQFLQGILHLALSAFHALDLGACLGKLRVASKVEKKKKTFEMSWKWALEMVSSSVAMAVSESAICFKQRSLCFTSCMKVRTATKGSQRFHMEMTCFLFRNLLDLWVSGLPVSFSYHPPFPSIQPKYWMMISALFCLVRSQDLLIL